MAKKGPSPVDIEVGRRIRLQRMSAGMSQTELAHEIGVTFQQVQKYEKGANRVGAGRLTQIATALSLPISAFFESADEASAAKGKPASSPVELLTQPNALRLLQAYSAIPDESIRASIVRLVEAIRVERGGSQK
jgi:transcriptional regulator with XRE-family HTH domain